LSLGFQVGGVLLWFEGTKVLAAFVGVLFDPDLTGGLRFAPTLHYNLATLQVAVMPITKEKEEPSPFTLFASVLQVFSWLLCCKNSFRRNGKEVRTEGGPR
jgi:hypothetical protein